MRYAKDQIEQADANKKRMSEFGVVSGAAQQAGLSGY